MSTFKPWQTVLCATDFSPSARAAMETAVELAAVAKARLHLAYIYAPAATYIPDGLVGASPTVVAQMERDVEVELGRWKAAATLQAGGRVEVVARAELGLPFGSIVDLAEKLPAQLIVMGTRGRTGLAHVLLGSVAERVVRFAPCPVLTVRGTDAARVPGRILVASDLSPSSRPALQTALGLATLTSAELDVLHVREGELHNRALFSAEPLGDRELLARIAGREVEDAARALGDQLATLDEGPSRRVAATLVKTGIASDVILSTAAELEADLIVVGTHGRRGFSHALLGSVAERVARAASVPVLTVPSRNG